MVAASGVAQSVVVDVDRGHVAQVIAQVEFVVVG